MEGMFYAATLFASKNTQPNYNIMHDLFSFIRDDWSLVDVFGRNKCRPRNRLRPDAGGACPHLPHPPIGRLLRLQALLKSSAL